MYPINPNAYGVLPQDLKKVLMHTPLQGKHKELIPLSEYDPEGYYQSSLAPISFTNTGYKPVKPKSAMGFSMHYDLCDMNQVMVEEPQLDRTVFILGLTNSVWEPGKSITLLAHQDMIQFPFVVSFTGSVDDLFLFKTPSKDE